MSSSFAEGPHGPPCSIEWCESEAAVAVSLPNGAVFHACAGHEPEGCRERSLVVLLDKDGKPFLDVATGRIATATQADRAATTREDWLPETSIRRLGDALEELGR